MVAFLFYCEERRRLASNVTAYIMMGFWFRHQAGLVSIEMFAKLPGSLFYVFFCDVAVFIHPLLPTRLSPPFERLTCVQNPACTPCFDPGRRLYWRRAASTSARCSHRVCGRAASRRWSSRTFGYRSSRSSWSTSTPTGAQTKDNDATLSWVIYCVSSGTAAVGWMLVRPVYLLVFSCFVCFGSFSP